MKNITKNWLKKHNVCQDARDWILSFLDKSGENIFKKCINEKKYDWLNWGICRIFNKEQKIKYAIYAANLVLAVYERQYPGDNRPRNAINAAKKYLIIKNKKTVSDAVNAANSAAVAVNAANFSYTANAAYAAYAATCAADAAAAAADAAAAAADAADVVARDYEKEKIQKKILQYGKKLLDGTKILDF